MNWAHVRPKDARRRQRVTIIFRDSDALLAGVARRPDASIYTAQRGKKGVWKGLKRGVLGFEFALPGHHR